MKKEEGNIERLPCQTESSLDRATNLITECIFSGTSSIRSFIRNELAENELIPAITFFGVQATIVERGPSNDHSEMNYEVVDEIEDSNDRFVFLERITTLTGDPILPILLFADGSSEVVDNIVESNPPYLNELLVEIAQSDSPAALTAMKYLELRNVSNSPPGKVKGDAPTTEKVYSGLELVDQPKAPIKIGSIDTANLPLKNIQSLAEFTRVLDNDAERSQLSSKLIKSGCIREVLYGSRIDGWCKDYPESYQKYSSMTLEEALDFESRLLSNDPKVYKAAWDQFEKSYHWNREKLYEQIRLKSMPLDHRILETLEKQAASFKSEGLLLDELFPNRPRTAVDIAAKMLTDPKFTHSKESYAEIANYFESESRKYRDSNDIVAADRLRQSKDSVRRLINSSFVVPEEMALEQALTKSRFVELKNFDGTVNSDAIKGLLRSVQRDIAKNSYWSKESRGAFDSLIEKLEGNDPGVEQEVCARLALAKPPKAINDGALVRKPSLAEGVKTEAGLDRLGESQAKTFEKAQQSLTEALVGFGMQRNRADKLTNEAVYADDAKQKRASEEILRFMDSKVSNGRAALIREATRGKGALVVVLSPILHQILGD